MSGDSSHYDTGGEGARAVTRGGGRYGRETRPQHKYSHDETGGFDDDRSTADEHAGAMSNRSGQVGFPGREGGEGGGGERGGQDSKLGSSSSVASSAAPTSATKDSTIRGPNTTAEGFTANTPATQQSPAVPSALDGGRITTGHLSAGSGEAAVPVASSSSTSPQHSTSRHFLRHGAPGKEDGSVWSDQDTVSSAAPSPLGQGRGHAGSVGGEDSGATPSRRRPPSLQADLVGIVNEAGEDVAEAEKEEEEESGTRAASVAETSSASNVSLRVNPSLSPVRTHLEPPRQREEEHATGYAGENMPSVFGRNRSAGRSRAVSSSGGGGGGGGGGADAASVGEGFGSAAASAGDSSLHGATRPTPDGGDRERQGFGNLLRMGGKRIGMGGRGGEDAEAHKAVAAELRAEVEELSLELEDAEDRCERMGRSTAVF